MGGRGGIVRNGIAVMALAVLGIVPGAAAAQSVTCFGNEPSWSVVLEGPTAARLLLPDEPEVLYRGAGTRLTVLHERVWPGAPSAGAGGDLVVFLRDADCSDTMSDQTHPVVARVSLADGRVLAGCCRVPSAAPAPAAAPAAPSAIEGPLWELTHLRGQSDKAVAGLRVPITARFASGRLQAFAGCNQMMGGYAIDGDRVRLDALAGTMMACPPPVMAVEDAFKAALSGALVFRVEGDRLTLGAPADAEPAMVFRAAPPPRIEGVTWKVTGYNNGRQAVVGPLKGTVLTLSFADGAVSGRAGCNTFHATYTRDDSHLTIGPIAATRKMCAKDIMTQEQEFLAALGSTTVWAIDRGMLDLHRADGERVLTASPESAR